MALLSGFEPLDSANNTFSDWLNKTNELINLMRVDVVTANNSIANTDGNMNLNGYFTANTVHVTEELAGGSYNWGTLQFETTDLLVVSNTVFGNTAALVTIENDGLINGDLQVTSNLTVITDSWVQGDARFDSTVTVTGNTTNVVITEGVQTFFTGNNAVELSTDANGALNVDTNSNTTFTIDTLKVLELVEGGNVHLYDSGGNIAVHWDSSTQNFGINIQNPTVDLDVAANTHTANLVVHDTANVNIGIIDTLTVQTHLTGNSDLRIISNTDFVGATNRVYIENDLNVGNDVTVGNDLTVDHDLLVSNTSTVDGFATFNDHLLVTGVSTNVEIFEGVQTFTTGSNTVQLSTDANGALNVDTNSNTTFTIDTLKVLELVEGGDVHLYDNLGNKAVYWDASTQNLGINIQNPTVDLDVAANTHTANLVVHDTADIETGFANTLTVETHLTGATELDIISNTNFTGAVANVHIANDLNVDNDVRVGQDFWVGNTSTVDGFATFNDSVLVTGISTNVEILEGVQTFTTGANVVSFGTGTNGQLDVATNSNITYTIDGIKILELVEGGDLHLHDLSGNVAVHWDSSTQNLGINTLNPTVELDVSGNTHTDNLVVHTDADINIANVTTLTVDGTLRGLTELDITTNTNFTASVANVHIINDLNVDKNVVIGRELQVSNTISVDGHATFNDHLLVTGATTNVEIIDGVQTFTTGANVVSFGTGTNGQLDIATNHDITYSIDGVTTFENLTGGDVYLQDNLGARSLHWDASTKRLGINTLNPTVDLDVTGDTHTTNLVVDTNTYLEVANVTTLTVEGTLRGLTELTITTNTNFTQVNGEVDIANDLRIGGDLHYVLNSNNFLHLIPETTGQDLGSTTKRWDGFFANTTIYSRLLPSANSIPLGSTTKRFDGWLEDLNVANSATVTGQSTLATTTISDLTVTGDGDIANGIIDTLHVTGSISGNGTSLELTENTSVTGTLDVSSNTTLNNLTVNGTLSYVIDDSNYVDLIPTTTGDNLGSTTNRWDGFFNNVDIGDYLSANTVEIVNLTVSGSASLPENVSLSGTASFENIEVSNTANINNLSVFGLTTNTAAIVGDVADVSVATKTAINTFDAVTTKGFKYLVHGTNADPNSTYMVEIMCAHNDTNIYYTRYGELANAFNVTVEPSINTVTSEVHLEVTCPSASGTNVHSFNIVRIDTRDN